MNLTKNFEYSQAENKWYDHWLEKKYFNSKPDSREPYTIVMPPPNVTGILHMGHCLNNTIQDILIRRARMQEKNACWVPGTDHASIATEAKVVQMLRERGISKSSLSRNEFLKYAWDWKEQYGGIILQQLKKLGCSPDWDRTTFTMDPDYYDSVINVFIDLYNKGFIYRGKRMINWDPKAKTALSDEEVIRKEVNSKLYFVRYQLADENGKAVPLAPLGDGGITIATVRPETILGDTAIAVNPNDDRYKHLHGKFAFVPLINRRIPIIADEYVEKDFGTGALKITPAHDKNDYQIGEKHGLEIIDILNDDGTMSEAAQLYIGEDRFEARKKIIKELEAKGYLEKVEDYTNQIGFSERTDVAIEDRLSLQWWVAMKKLYKPALEAVINEEIKFYPAKFKNLYRNWMENIRDWCISRQLWWGHRIPAWYDEEGRFVVAKNEEEAKKIFNVQYSISNVQLKQDEDVLDTWFSSWLWPFQVFNGYSNPGNQDIKYYYPTNTLVTAPEIIFFWVARMIMAGFEYMHEKPFSNVYFTGIVRDELGRKMSKQLGNSPDLLGLIEKYGADAVRFGIIISSPAGNDLLFDVKEESSLKQGSFFINKMWNALKLVKMWEEKKSKSSIQNSEENFSVKWFESRLNQVKTEIEELYKDFRLSEILKTIYSLIWDDFCSWYLEWIKPGFEEPIDADVYNKSVEYFEQLIQLLHPFMPFVTEEIYHQLKERKEADDLTVKRISEFKIQNSEILKQAALLKEVITAIRDARNKNQLKPRDQIKLHIQAENTSDYKIIEGILQKQVNAASINYVKASVSNSINIVVQKDKFFLETENQTDTANQKEQLQKDLAYLEGFLASVEKKLSNDRFIQNAKPEVVEIERKKKADAEAKIKAIQESLAALS
ncbi:MAG TPA: valine--tRNA ligase [Chitinophagaceae bacterium]|jgi:valyl-tRNA synthetase|nr:valine--tRNA ligase [Chitinophagaceae bacterium]